MRPRALIFDDDLMIRQMLWTACDRRGYEVFTFPDPAVCPLHVNDGCSCTSEGTCADIIISDLDMPNVKGLDFVEKLLGKGCRCRHIALMSGAWSDSDIARAAELGCKLFAKPFHIGQITAWLEQVERELSPDRRLHDWQSLRSAGEP
jgi:DNA-binding response OmpR family regulator